MLKSGAMLVSEMRGNIFCAYKDAQMLQARYPKRKVLPSMYCPNGEFVVMRKFPFGVFRVKIDDWSVWVPSEFPYFVRWL